MRQCEAPPPGHQAALLHVMTTEYDPQFHIFILATISIINGAMAEYLGGELAPIPRLVLELVHFIGTITPGPAPPAAALQHCSTAALQVTNLCRCRYILQSSGRAFTTEKLALVNQE